MEIVMEVDVLKLFHFSVDRTFVLLDSVLLSLADRGFALRVGL